MTDPVYKVMLYPADWFGCGNYRMVWPARSVQHAAGGQLDITVVPPGQGAGLSAAMLGEKVVSTNLPEGTDLVVFQRPSNAHIAAAIPMIREQGAAVVVDIDDDLACIHPSNPAFTALHPKYNPKNNWRHTEAACKASDLVTVSTPELAKRYGGRFGNRVLPNYVPREFLSVPRIDSETVGWAGSTHSHPDDLQVTGNAFARLGLEYSERFRVVGPGMGVRQALGLLCEPVAAGKVEFEDWPTAVAQLGVGLAPLSDTRFNAAKSWLKPLEYSAVGVPWVASDRVEYTRLHKLGAGLLARKPKEWEATIRRLCSDAGLRAELSGQGRTVAAGLTIQEHAWKWAETWVQTIMHAREWRPVPA